MVRKQNQVTVSKLISVNEEPPLLTPDIQEEIILNVDLSEIPSSSRETDYDILRRKYEELQAENVSLKEKINIQENEQKNLQQHISHLENKLKEGNLQFNDRVKEALKDCLTSNQVDIILKKKSKARWTQEELSRAFTLRLV